MESTLTKVALTKPNRWCSRWRSSCSGCGRSGLGGGAGRGGALPVLARGVDLRGIRAGPAQHARRALSRPAAGAAEADTCHWYGSWSGSGAARSSTGESPDAKQKPDGDASRGTGGAVHVDLGAADVGKARRTEKVSEVVARSIMQDIATRGLPAGTKLPPESVMLDRYEWGGHRFGRACGSSRSRA